MPRKKRKDFKRKIEPDYKYNNVKISKFINRVMLSGKKRVAERLVYSALKRLSDEVGLTVVEAFEKALKNVMPLMEVKSRRVGGSTYQVPVDVKPDRSLALAMRWIVDHARKKSGSPMEERLGNELIDSYKNSGVSIKKKEDTHKMAEANKAFAHFRW